MADLTPPSTQQLQQWLDGANGGDHDARDELLLHTYRRLLELTRRMLRSYGRLRQFEESGDVLQGAQRRLLSALTATRPPTLTDFFRLAGAQIRRELIDLSRHYFGPRGEGSNRAVGLPAEASGDAPAPAHDPADSTLDPARKAADKDELRELHERVGGLPIEERTVVDLLYYQGLTQPGAAEVLGVSEATVKRRWLAARLRLGAMLQGEAD
jgi:RNA polymerase sigma-70 factor (ECF subfamily)